MVLIQRYDRTLDRTIGRLYVDQVFKCYTLEDGLASPKGCIPAGEYNLDLTYSPRFNRMLPLVEDVPGFTGIRIHAGNTHRDTEGCILVGLRREADEILDSRSAVQMLLEDIEFPTRLKIEEEGE